MTDQRLEGKLGFDKIRKLIADRCLTDYAAARVAEEHFSTDAGIIRQRLTLTVEMRLILMFEENFPPRATSTRSPSFPPSSAPGPASTSCRWAS